MSISGIFTVTKKRSCKALYLFRVALLLVIGVSPGLAGAVMLSFSPSEQDVELGQQATVGVYLRDPAGSRIGAFNFNVEYDATLLSLQNVIFSDGFGNGALGSFQDIQTPTAGQVNVAELAFAFDLSPFQDGVSDFLLFSLTFDTVSTGISLLGFSEDILGVAGGYLMDEFGLPVGPVDLAGGRITVASRPVTVSEPGSLLLVIAGLAGMLRRRKGLLKLSADGIPDAK